MGRASLLFCQTPFRKDWEWHQRKAQPNCTFLSKKQFSLCHVLGAPWHLLQEQHILCHVLTVSKFYNFKLASAPNLFALKLISQVPKCHLRKCIGLEWVE